MKYLKIFIQIIILFSFSTVLTYGNEKVAFADIDYVIKNSSIGKIFLKKMDELNQKNIDILKEREKLLKDIENELKKKQNLISKDEFNKEVNLLKNKINDFKIEKNSMVRNYNILKDKELDLLFKKINPIIQNYMNKNSIEILLDRKDVFIGSINSDITNKLINEIDKGVN